MIKVTIINGPNLNLLGKREEKYYGDFTLSHLEEFLLDKKSKDMDLEFFQSNSEESIINKIHTFSKKNNYLIINLGAFTHTSIAIRDAILSVEIPFIEVHISNIYSRESFRHTSYLSDIAIAQISGLGKYGYLAAMEYFYNNFS